MSTRLGMTGWERWSPGNCARDQNLTLLPNNVEPRKSCCGIATSIGISFLVRLHERIIMKEAVHVDCSYADGWLSRCGTGNSAAVTAVKGLVWNGMVTEVPWIFLLRTFLPEVGPARVLKGGYELVDGAAPGVTVSSKCRPQVIPINCLDIMNQHS